jgi:hypothetical protein
MRSGGVTLCWWASRGACLSSPHIIGCFSFLSLIWCTPSYFTTLLGDLLSVFICILFITIVVILFGNFQFLTRICFFLYKRFRISSWINSAKANQPNRAKAPLSVTSVHSLSADNEGRYISEFTKTQIPLDSGYDGEEAFSGSIYRHGVTNDLRVKWIESASALRTDKLRDSNDLENELLRLKLITTPTLVAAHGGKRRKPVVEPGRKLRRRIKNSNARRTNTHLNEDPTTEHA